MASYNAHTHARPEGGCQREEAFGQKAVFRVAQDTTVPLSALVRPAMHVPCTALWDGRRCPPRAAWGEFGLRTSCPSSGQWTPLVSHGVTVGHHRAGPWHSVITPNQRGFMNSSLPWASANKPTVFIISKLFRG